MGLGRTLIILGLIGSVVACLASAMPQGTGSDDQKILRSQGSTFLSNGAGQIIRGADGKTILIGSDGRRIIADTSISEEDASQDDDSFLVQNNGGSSISSNDNNIFINGGQSNIITSNGKTLQYGTGNINYSGYNGHSINVVNGVITLREGGKQYTFEAQPPNVEKREAIVINGQPATVQYSHGDVIVELADQTVIAIVGNTSFIGDRTSFENRDKLQAEAKTYAENIQRQVQEGLKKSLQQMNEDLQKSLGNIRF
ncbi:GL17667 [Drosophila persimilis]|uniref:GL17667 n=1 Tax=Drosophila persimilis TaxID=7234 RepID=B4GI73_DROPE|nr:uncharacterized protein LOC6593233 [Drosophila persimilis]EDW36193.1 GL17667 [Drosophila persimilis]